METKVIFWKQKFRCPGTKASRNQFQEKSQFRTKFRNKTATNLEEKRWNRFFQNTWRLEVLPGQNPKSNRAYGKIPLRQRQPRQKQLEKQRDHWPKKEKTTSRSSVGDVVGVWEKRSHWRRRRAQAPHACSFEGLTLKRVRKHIKPCLAFKHLTIKDVEVLVL